MYDNTRAHMRGIIFTRKKSQKIFKSLFKKIPLKYSLNSRLRVIGKRIDNINLIGIGVLLLLLLLLLLFFHNCIHSDISNTKMPERILSNFFVVSNNDFSHNLVFHFSI